MVSDLTCVCAEGADLADALDPAVHLFLSLGQQVEDAVRRLHHKQVLVLEWALLQWLGRLLPLMLHLPAVYVDLTLLEVNGADGLPRAFVPVVFQHVWVAAHAALAQDKPAFPP